MLVTYIALLPEVVLLFGILLMALVRIFRAENTPKTFLTLAKWTILPTIALTAVFYDRDVGAVWSNNDYTTLFKIVIYLFALGWGTLSLKRFQNRENSSFSFYFLLLLNLLGFSLMLSARSLPALAAAAVYCQLLNYPLLKTDAEEEALPQFRRYLVWTLLFCLLLAGGVWKLCAYADSTSYADVSRFLAEQTVVSWQLRLAFVMIMVFFLFALGVAPFHFWFADVLSGAILPVGGYLTIVPVLAYFSVFVNLIANVLAPLYGWFVPVMLIFGVLSVFIGAIGANSEDNLRRIFAYAGLYYVGVLLIASADMHGQSLVAALVYLLVYVLAFFGIYTVFAGCRSKGEYLHYLNEVRGLSTQRPFLAATLLILMISLIGTPPLLGFLGKLSVINALVAGGSYGLMAVVAFSMLILVYAYLKIITVIYFEPRNISFDRVDKGVYTYIALNLLLIAVTVVNPKYLMHDAEIMLTAILQAKNVAAF